MPEAVIQRADQYQADKYNKGVLTPDKSAAMVASPGIYNHALVSMYNDKYSSSFEDFDKFKAAYQSQYGDPFKKKEPSATPSPTKKVQSFQTSEPRTTTPLNEALKDAANQPQELPSENYVTPSEGTQVATFQTGGDRKQIPIEDAQKPSGLDAKRQEADALLSAQSSKGLITNATPEQQKNLDTSNALQASNAADATNPAYMEDYKQPSESTAIKTSPLTAEEAGSYGQPYSKLENAIDYTKIAARQITGVVPGMIDGVNIALSYADEKISGNPGAYTQEERDAAFNNATLAEKALAYISGERATASYNEFEKNYLTGSKANEESEAGAYASAIGQIIPMFLTGGASAGAKATQLAFKGASALNKAKFLVNGAGKLIVETSKSPATYIAAQQIFNDTFQEAYKATGDSDKAMLAAGVNTAASAGLEALPFLNFTKRLDNMTGGTVKKVLISGAVGGGAELVTEVAQTFTDNLVASNIYDETRKLTDGLAQSGEIGGVVGFTLSAVMASLHIRLKNSTDPYERQEIQKSIDEIAPKVVEAKKQENILANAVENEAVVQKNVEVQKALSDDNISTQTIVEASQLRTQMPNYEEVNHKTVGLENKINQLMVEKNGLYDKVDGSGNINEQTKTADARSKAIDKEIRVISNQIADVYAQPSKEIVDQETASEVDNTPKVDKSAEVIAPDATIHGVPKTKPSIDVDIKPIKKDWTDTDFNALSKEGGINKVGSDLYIGPKADIGELIEKHGNFVVRVKDANGYSAELPANEYAEMIKNKTFSDRVKQVSFAFGGRNQGLPSGFMSDIRKGNELVLTDGDISDNLNLPTGTELVSKSTVNPQKAKEIINTINNADVQELIQNLRIKKIVIEKPGALGLSEQGNYHSQSKTLTLSADLDTPLQTILHEIGHDRFDNLSDKNKAELRDIARKDKRTTYEQNLDEFIVDNFYQGNNYFKSIKETKADLSIRLKQNQIKENNTENTKEDGTQQKPIDTSTTNQGTEASSNEAIAPKVAEPKTKVAGRGKTPLDKRNVNNPDILSALSHDVSDAEDITLQSFVRGEITPTKEVYNELYANSNGEKKSAIGIIRTPEKGGKTLDQMAHKLWETQPNNDQYSTSEFKNAIENVIKTNSSKLSAAIKLNDKFNAPIEVDGKRVNSSGEQLHETPHGWMTQGSIDDFAATEEFKKDVSADDYNEVMQEYDNLSDEEFHKLFTESQSDEKITIADKSETIKEVKEKATTEKETQIQKDSIDLTQGEFEAKHPEEDYDTTQLYATKDTEVAMEANKKSENPENFVMYANGFNIPFTVGNVPAKIKAGWIKTFQKGAGIPYQLVYEMSVKRKSTIDRRTQELDKMVKDIHKNIVKKINEDIDQKIKENPKEKSTLNLTKPKHNVIPENIALELNDRFAGRKTSNLISEDIMLEIDKARNSVISLQKEMVAMDLLDTDIHLGTNEKGEYYVNRTYRKFDDKGWKDKIPQKVMNKAILVLRDLYNSRDTNVESLANKKDNLIKSAEQKIEDRIANLQEKKILVANTVGKIDKKIRVNSKNANIPTQDIDALKQRKEMLLNKIAKLESDTKTKNKKTEFYIKKAKKDLGNFLRDNKGNTEIDIDGHIEKDIQRFITSDPDAYSGNVSGESAKVVSSIFKSKSEFLNDNKALRDVMGEVNDPFINILNTAHKMITTIENYKSQKRMKDLGMDVLFSTKPSKKFNTELKLGGMPGLTEDGVLYTTPEFAESFKIMESAAPQVTNEVLKTIGNGLGWIKMGKTVMSTPAAINNYVSNIKHIATNGWNPAYALKNYVSLSKTAKIADIKDLLDRGILSQSIQGRELQDRKNALIGGFSIKETVSRMPMLDVGAKVLGSLSDFHAKIFANGDNYAKYVGFYAEMSALRDIYPKWSEDQLRHEAAIIVSKISPTFDMVSPGIEKIRKSNVFSTFATFPAEQIRNRYNVGLLIKEDFKSGDKERIKRAARRLSGQLVGVGLSAALLGLSKYFIGAGYEKIKDLQIFQSQYSKNNAITYLSRNGDELEYIDLSRTDYDSYLLVAPLIGFVSGDYDKEAYENKLIRSAQALSSPFTDTNILTETMADVIYGRVLDTGDAIDSENDTFAEKLRKASKHAMSKLEPTNIKIVRNWYDLADTGKDEYGGTITPRTAMMKTVGFGGKTLNITKQFAYHFYTIKAQNDDDKNKFERSYNNARTDDEKAKITERYTNQLVIGVSKMSHLSRVAQQNSGNMKNISDLMDKLPKELKYAAAYGEMPEYKDTPIIQVGVDAYVNNVVQKLIYKK